MGGGGHCCTPLRGEGDTHRMVTPHDAHSTLVVVLADLTPFQLFASDLILFDFSSFHSIASDLILFDFTSFCVIHFVCIIWDMCCCIHMKKNM